MTSFIRHELMTFPTKVPLPSFNNETLPSIHAVGFRLSGMSGFHWDVSEGTITYVGFVRDVFGLQETTSRTLVQGLLPYEGPDLRNWIELLQTIANVTTDRETFEFTSQHTTPDGSTIWIRARGEFKFTTDRLIRRVQNAVGCFEDITFERSRQAQYAAILESIGDGIVSFDKDWRYRYVNRKAVLLLGRSPEQLIGGVFWELFPEVKGTALESTLRTGMDGKPASYEYFYAPWGRWFANYCSPQSDGGLTVYFQDITERRSEEKEQELSRSRSTLEQFNIAAQTVAALAHELNQPLMALQANSSSLGHLLRDIPLAPDVKTILAENERQTERASSVFQGLIQKIHSWRDAVVQSSVYDIHAVIETCLRQFMLQYPDLVIQTQFDADRSKVRGNQIQTEKALLNVIVNAAQACIEHKTSAVHVWIQTSVCDGNLRIQVRDSGMGVGSEMMKYLFTEFKTTKKTGLGLGLSIAKSLMESQGGRLWFHGNVNNGAEFRIEAPLAT